MPEVTRIGLFGGTFDPVHLGHVHLASVAREAASLDEVRFLPCRISPHKPGRPPASPRDRMEMLKLATADLAWATVDDWELTGTGPSYSYLTVEEMVSRQPHAAWFWIMGSDQWDALPTWKHPEILAKHVTFLVLARGSLPRSRPGYRMQVIEGSHAASSTAIRQAAQGNSEPLPFLHPDVAAYIRHHHLYLGEPPLASAETSP